MGLLFLDLCLPAPPPPLPSAALFHTLSRTIFHTPLCHTPLCHTPLCHTHSFTHPLSHSLFHTPLCHTPSLSHTLFVTHHLSHTSLSRTHHLSHTLFVTHHLSHTLFHTPLCHTPSFTGDFASRGRRGTWSHLPSLCVAGMALMALGRLWWRAWSPLVARDSAPLCVAGVALGDIYLHFVALANIHRRFAWQAWHLRVWHWAVSGGALGPRWSPVTPDHFGWQASRLVSFTFTLRGRRGTCKHPPSFCVAHVALPAKI